MAVCVEDGLLIPGAKWCSPWAEVVRPHQAALGSGPLEKRRLAKLAPIETDFRPVRCTTTCNKLHPPSRARPWAPHPLSIVSSSAENTFPARPFVTLAFVRWGGLAF